MARLVLVRAAQPATPGCADVDPANPQLPAAATKPSAGLLRGAVAVDARCSALYRSIGGDSAHLAARRSASDYAVYLVIEAIQLLGARDGRCRRYAVNALRRVR